MIKIIPYTGSFPNSITVLIDEKEIIQVIEYCNLININPWAGWPHGNLTPSKLLGYVKNNLNLYLPTMIEDKIPFYWDKNCEKYIHSYNELYVD